MKLILYFCLVCSLFLNVGCASRPTDPIALQAYQEANDPLEPMNRAIFSFNLLASDYVFTPVIKTYRAVTTSGFRQKINNFLDNLKAPWTILNDALQLNFKQAGLDTSRMIINSTIGFFGFFDVAAEMGIEPHLDGFATTLGVWGVPSGPYLVLPFLGPSNLRDTTGFLTSFAFDPVAYAAQRNSNTDIVKTLDVLKVLEGIVAYDSALDLMNAGRMTSLDFYAYMRTTYSQYRKKTIDDAKGIKEEENNLSSYDFSLDGDDEFDYEF